MAEQDPTAERWLPVVGYEGFYEVSSLGRVRSLRNDNKVLTPRLSTNGYVTVGLNLRGRKVKALVHRLVLSAFSRPPFAAEVGNHIDFDKTNNRPGNLEWTSSAGNSAHAKAAGRMNSPTGERHGGSVLTSDEVRQIRSMCDGGFSQYYVARLFCVSQGHIALIVSRKRWAHVA